MEVKGAGRWWACRSKEVIECRSWRGRAGEGKCSSYKCVIVAT